MKTGKRKLCNGDSGESSFSSQTLREDTRSRAAGRGEAAQGIEEQWPPQEGDRVKSRNGRFRFTKKIADSSLGRWAKYEERDSAGRFLGSPLLSVMLLMQAGSWGHSHHQCQSCCTRGPLKRKDQTFFKYFCFTKRRLKTDDMAAVERGLQPLEENGSSSS